MDDRTMLELAAKAAGINYDADASFPKNPVRRFFGLWLVIKGEPGEYAKRRWNPLTDDGDAFRLMVKLGLSITPYPFYDLDHNSVIVKQRRTSDILREPNPSEIIGVYNGAPLVATRRAITRAAAEIQLAKENGK